MKARPLPRDGIPTQNKSISLGVRCDSQVGSPVHLHSGAEIELILSLWPRLSKLDTLGLSSTSAKYNLISVSVGKWDIPHVLFLTVNACQ